MDAVLFGIGVPLRLLLLCRLWWCLVLVFPDKASIRRLKSHASDYGQGIRKMECQMPSFARKDSGKPLSFAKGDDLASAEAAEGAETFESGAERLVSSSLIQMDDVEVDLASMNDEEYQSMVLEHGKTSDRQLVDQHFQQENAFKASLTPAQKQALDYEVATT